MNRQLEVSCLVPCVCALALLRVDTAFAGTEVHLDGHFRLRAHVYDNLSLTRDSSQSSSDSSGGGTQNYLEQRMRFEPEFRVNQFLSVFAQIDVLPDLVWGTSPAPMAGLYDYYDALGQSQTFTTPSSGALVPNRAWAEIYSPIGRFKVGRTGMEVGSGIFFNDGNDPDSDYQGDTADRIQYLTRLGPIYLLAGYDLIYEGAVDRPYEAWAGAAAIAYRSELASSSFYLYYQDDSTWLEETESTPDEGLKSNFSTWTFDLWGKSTLGPVEVELEALYRYGGGADSRLVLQSTQEDVAPKVLEGATLSAWGGMARMKWKTKTWHYGLETGLASGDVDVPPTDSDRKLNALAFDPNYHLGLLLFRVPLPTSLSTDVEGSGMYEDALVGNQISNVYYLMPSLEFAILPNLQANVKGIGAWALATPSEFNGSKKYGYELDFGLKSQLFDRLSLEAEGALFFPGAVFGSDPDFAFGSQISATVSF